MKKIFGVALTLACLLLGAANVQAVEAIRIWQKASGENFPAFQADMLQNGWGVPGGMTANGVAEEAYNYAFRNDLVKFAPETNQDKEPWKGMFRRWNGAVGDTVSWDTFRIRGQNVGWLLPVETEEASSTTISLSEAGAELGRLNEKLSSVSGQAGNNQEAVNSFKQELSEFRSALGPLTEKNASMLGAVNELVMVVEMIKEGWQTPEMISTTMALLDERVENQLGEVKKLITAEASTRAAADEAHDTQIEAVKKSIDEKVSTSVEKAVGDKFTAVEKSIDEKVITAVVKSVDEKTAAVDVGSWKFWAYIIGGMLILISLGRLWWLGRKTKANEVALNGDGSGENLGVVADVAELKKTLGGTEENPGLVGKVAKLAERADATDKTFAKEIENRNKRSLAIEKSHKQLALSTVGCSFDVASVGPGKLRRLKVDGSGSVIPITLLTQGETTTVNIRAQRTGDNHITLHGVLRQKGAETVLVVDSLDNVPSVINRASKDGRIIGIDDPQS